MAGTLGAGPLCVTTLAATTSSVVPVAALTPALVPASLPTIAALAPLPTAVTPLAPVTAVTTVTAVTVSVVTAATGRSPALRTAPAGVVLVVTIRAIRHKTIFSHKFCPGAETTKAPPAEEMFLNSTGGALHSSFKF